MFECIQSEMESYFCIYSYIQAIYLMRIYIYEILHSNN